MNDKTAIDHPKKTLVDRLRDWIWQNPDATAAIFFGILSIVVAYNVFFLEQAVKSLQVTILSSTSLVEIERSVAEDIVVLYKGQPVDNLSLVTVKLENTGNQAIREEDYARPIRFIFPEPADIVEVVILETHPSNIGMTLLKEQNTATLLPVLLNEGDRGIFRFLVVNTPLSTEDNTPSFRVDARVAEVKDIQIVNAIEERSPVEKIGVLPAILLVISLTLFILSLSVYLLTQKSRAETERLLNESLDELRRGLTPKTPNDTV
jgi:hypothetical protein